MVRGGWGQPTARSRSTMLHCWTAWRLPSISLARCTHSRDDGVALSDRVKRAIQRQKEGRERLHACASLLCVHGGMKRPHVLGPQGTLPSLLPPSSPPSRTCEGVAMCAHMHICVHGQIYLICAQYHVHRPEA